MVSSRNRGRIKSRDRSRTENRQSSRDYSMNGMRDRNRGSYNIGDRLCRGRDRKRGESRVR